MVQKNTVLIVTIVTKRLAFLLPREGNFALTCEKKSRPLNNLKKIVFLAVLARKHNVD